jgi:hypothetical protein
MNRLMKSFVVTLLFFLFAACSQSARAAAADGPQSATVPLFVEFNRPFIELELARADGSRRKARFWVDTGGGAFILCEPLARDLGLKMGAEQSEGQQRFAMADAPQAKVGEMPLDLAGARVIVALGRKTIDDGVAAEGMFPGHVLKRYHVVFDYPARLFTLARPGTLKPRGSRLATPIHERSGFPRIETRIGDSTSGFLLDTGASFTMISQEALERWAKENPRWRRATGAAGAANMGLGPMEAKLMMLRIPEMAIGEFGIKGAAAVARPRGTFETYMSKMMTAPIIGAIGGNILKLFRIEIDYANGATYIERHADYDQQDLDIVGLTLKTAADGGYTVVGVSDQYGADIAQNIKQGDRLVSVDSFELSGVTIDKAIDALRGKPGQKRALTLERDGKRITINVPVLKLL